MLPADLKSDCSRCAALCCVAYEFTPEDGFAFSKPVNTRCRFLRQDHRCSIYSQREAQGLHACASYECYGAGQWITERFTRLERPALLERFRQVRSMNEVLAAISLGLQHICDDVVRVQLVTLRDELETLRADSVGDSRSRVSALRRRALELMRRSMRPTT